jgi:potassium efflux system protein
MIEMKSLYLKFMATLCFLAVAWTSSLAADPRVKDDSPQQTLLKTQPQNRIAINDMDVSLLPPANAENSSLGTAYRQLALARKANTVAEQQLYNRQNTVAEAIRHSKTATITRNDYEESKFNVFSAQSNFDETKVRLAEAKRLAELSDNRIRNLHEQVESVNLLARVSDLFAKRLENIQAQLSYENTKLSLAEERVDVLSDSEKIVEQQLKLEREFYRFVEHRYQNQQTDQQRIAVEKVVQDLQKQQEGWLEKLGLAQEQLWKVNRQEQSADVTATATAGQAAILAAKAEQAKRAQEVEKQELAVFEANERSDYLEQQIFLTRMQFDLTELFQKIKEEKNINELISYEKKLDLLESELQNTKTLLKQKINFLNQRNTVAPMISDNQQYPIILAELLRLTKIQLNQTHSLISEIDSQYKTTSQYIQNNLSKRQELPGLDLAQWQVLGSDLALIPTFTWHSIQVFFEELLEQASGFNVWQFIGLLLLTLFWVAVGAYAQQKMNQVLQVWKYLTTQNTLFKSLSVLVIKFIHNHLWGIVFVCTIFSIFKMAALSFATFKPFLILTAVWFTFSFMIHLARSWLLDNVRNQRGHDVDFYHKVKWLLVSSGIFTALTLLTDQLPVTFAVKDLFHRLFMLIVLIFSVMLLRVWRVIPESIAPYLQYKPAYLRRLVTLLSWLVPVLLISSTVLGLIGYVSLAWQISQYQGYFLIVIILYFLARGFTSDATEWIASQLVRTLKNGWLWCEAVLKPIEQIIQVIYFLLVVISLFYLYDLDENPFVVKQLQLIAQHPLFSISNSEITSLDILYVVTTLAIFYWLTRWMREFCFRWFYAKVEDIGLRNTLSVFSQYSIVIVGFFVVLDRLGIDLQSLALLASALAVGIGFGLRNLANDFVCGFLLLIERPVRKGDIVSIGSFEGEVTHIGMRAMTINTWDHMEVIVPNSETFSKTFTNWTHQDSIVRTVVCIKISREDDIALVQRLILETLEQLNSVLKDPPPEALLKELDSCLLEFQVNYYINMAKYRSRIDVRSAFLFALWERFSEHGIKPPYPTQDLIIKEIPQLSLEKPLS